MNYIPSAGPLSILPLAMYHEEVPTISHGQAMQIGQAHFDRVAASDGIDKQVQLHLWFEQSAALPDSIVDQLEAHSLMAKDFVLTMAAGRLFGRLANIQIMPTSRALEVVRLSFTLIEHPPADQSLFAPFVKWVKKFFTRG